jgi:hypothetical protein
MNDVLISIIGGSVGAAAVTGIFSLLRWRLDRRAVTVDRAADKKAETETEIRDIKVGLRMLLYADIKRHGKEYLARGHISTEELEDLIAMHRIYHDQLGGNGFLDSLMLQVKTLHIDD